MSIDIPIQVRFNDLDAYGHVNNSVYLSYLEVARCIACGDVFSKSTENGVWFLLISAEVKYKKFIKLTDKVFVRLTMTEAAGAKFAFTYSVHDGNGNIYAEAKTVHATFDAKLNKPIRVPDDVKQFAADQQE